MTDNALDFMSMTIHLTDDPKFVRKADTFKALAYVFMKHLSLWIKIHERYTDINSIMNNNLDIDAGLVYNMLFITANGDKELTTEEFDSVCISFKTFIDRNAKNLSIAHSVKNISDPRDFMWALCHYFFVPVRLQDTTIPKQIRDISLRKWLSVVFILPFMRAYAGKFSRAINNVAYVSSIYDRLINEPERITKLMKADDEFFFTSFGTSSSASAATTFVRIYMNLLLYSSLEVLKKYNPCFLECVRINPEYDGTWINPFDQLFNEQYDELTKLSELVVVKVV